MSGSFEIDGDQITIVFEYAVNLAKGQQTITDAAHGLWDRGAGDHGDARPAAHRAASCR